MHRLKRNKLHVTTQENEQLAYRPNSFRESRPLQTTVISHQELASDSDHRSLTVNDVPHFHSKVVNCAKLFYRDYRELAAAERYQDSHPKVQIPDQRYITVTKNCSNFIHKRRYITQPMSDEERDFPIAFSILIFKDIEQFERLLRAIYRPQNYYCVHVDKKSDIVVREAARSIANCFDNVFISSRSIDVVWGYFSVLEPELVCMKDLWKYTSWKYFINLAGQEFPLKTNGDIVKILKVYNGANNIEGTVLR